jgi:lysophospholipase L1-like esterase/tetratricopeptide (TPR) repeat protein
MLSRLLLVSVSLLASTELLLQLGYAVMWWLGSRGTEPPPARADDQRIVLCLGDSFTYGMGSSSPAKSYPQQLEHLLQQDDPRWRVVNRGWPGRNSREVLTTLEESLGTLRPQVVCILVGINDSWSRPALLQLPAGTTPEATTAAPTAGEPFVFRMRLPRLIATFRSKDPFRDHVDASATRRDQVDTGFLVGSWASYSPLMRLELRQDGSGSLDDARLRWTATEKRLTLQIENLPAIVYFWRDDGGTLVINRSPGDEARLARVAEGSQPRNPAAEGYAAMAQHDWATALACFEESLRIASTSDPEEPKLRAALVRCLVALGRREAALAQLDAIRSRHAERTDVQSSEGLANALMALGFEDEGAQVVDAAMAAGMEAPGLWTTQAQITEKRGDIAGARRAILRAIEMANAMKWTNIAFQHRTKARLHQGDDLLDLFADGAVAAHLQDQADDKTRQLLSMWRAKDDRKESALRAACDRWQVDDDLRARLLRLLQEALGKGADEWEEVLRSHLEQAIARCRAAGAEPVLATYPFRFKSRWMIQRLAATGQCPFVAHDEVFEAIRAARPDAVLTVTDGHCNDEGYGVMAEQFARAILPSRRPENPGATPKAR